MIVCWKFVINLQSLARIIAWRLLAEALYVSPAKGKFIYRVFFRTKLEKLAFFKFQGTCFHGIDEIMGPMPP